MGDIKDVVENFMYLNMGELEDENSDDVCEMVSAFAEAVGDVPIVRANVKKDVALIFNLLGYLNTEQQERVFRDQGISGIWPQPKDVREYIETQRQKISRDVSRSPRRRTGVKARVKKDQFNRLRNGEPVSPFDVFSFFGADEK